MTFLIQSKITSGSVAGGIVFADQGIGHHVVATHDPFQLSHLHEACGVSVSCCSSVLLPPIRVGIVARCCKALRHMHCGSSNRGTCQGYCSQTTAANNHSAFLLHVQAEQNPALFCPAKPVAVKCQRHVYHGVVPSILNLMQYVSSVRKVSFTESSHAIVTAERFFVCLPIFWLLTSYSSW